KRVGAVRCTDSCSTSLPPEMKNGGNAAPIRGRKAPAGSYRMPEGTGARWAGLELLRREPLGRAASYRQRILLTRDALRRFLASKGFFVGLDNSPHQVHAVELAHEAQVMS